MKRRSPSTPQESTASLPLQICQALRREIGEQLHPGDKLPSMRSLRDRFAVSINTIGVALDMLAREGVIEKRPGSGIYMTERSGRRHIGILSELDLLDPRIGHHFRLVAGEVKRQLARLGAEPLLYVGNVEPGPDTTSDEPTCPQFWSDAAEGRLDGGVIMNVPFTPRWKSRIADCPVPLVGASTGYSCAIDQSGVINAAVKHLRKKGGRHFAFMASSGGSLFQQAVAACGGTTFPSWVRGDLIPSVRGTGATALDALWSSRKERPDGVIILDDMLFADTQKNINSAWAGGPKTLQFAVLATEGAWPSSFIPYTALEVNAEEEATVMTDILLRRLHGERVAPAVQPLTFRLVEVEAQGESKRNHPIPVLTG